MEYNSDVHNRIQKIKPNFESWYTQAYYEPDRTEEHHTQSWYGYSMGYRQAILDAKALLHQELDLSNPA